MVYQALLGVGYTKEDIAQNHVDHDARPETTLLLAGKGDRVHRAGVLKFANDGSRGRIISFEAGLVVNDLLTVCRLIRGGAGLS